MLREEADQMFDGRLELLRAFIAERYDAKSGKWRGFVLHFEEDLVTLDKMIAGKL
jgi:hypothetical protein